LRNFFNVAAICAEGARGESRTQRFACSARRRRLSDTCREWLLHEFAGAPAQPVLRDGDVPGEAADDARSACEHNQSNGDRHMSTPASEQYKGFAIGVQALRRAKERNEAPDAPRRFDIVVTITRQTSGEHGKTEMFGVPEHEPLESPIEAHKIGVQYARDIIDGKVEGQSVAGL
jgi:hypothetical protein